jgi:putative ATP-dependent endonuclease of OLD family
MDNILIDKIRISGFRGLNDFEMDLCMTTVLTGMNNVGKTTVLKALQLALGSKTFLSTEDFNIRKNDRSTQIIIDVRIVAVDDKGNRMGLFGENWESVFTDNIQYGPDGKAMLPLRTTILYNILKGDFDKTQFVLKEWESEQTRWQDLAVSKSKLRTESIPFYYIEAQRDVVEDMKLRTSFLGKMLSEVPKSYDEKDIEALEEMIADLNEEAVSKSEILSIIQKALSGVDTAIDHKDSSINISPFAKKIRDLNKNISIQYGENEETFTMDYHGMGTRSWSSLLTFKAFLNQSVKYSSTAENPYFPVIAIEEPEAHLHPNAQKKLYNQIKDIPGQKIISTHSPYIAACAELNEIRNLYKGADIVEYGSLDLEEILPEEQRKIKQKVINTKGEIFFSKALVLFEGETEEQALPILAEKHFGCPASELGIDFVGVGGAGSYYPFIKFANDLNIPWFIFSDGEDGPVKNMSKAVQKSKGSSFTNINNESNVFIIDLKEDFEKYIIRLNYLEDIKDYIKSVELPNCANVSHKSRKITEIDAYTSEYILNESKAHKTKFALIYAYAIYNSEKPLPPLVIALFDRIKNELRYE